MPLSSGITRSVRRTASRRPNESAALFSQATSSLVAEPGEISPSTPINGSADQSSGTQTPKTAYIAQLQHVQMLDSMDRKARQLCDDTRRQYEMLLQRQEAQYERHLQALQHKLREVLSSSISLHEHRQALNDLSRLHERDTLALTKAHGEETVALRLSCKKIANDHQLRSSRAFQDEKDLLLEKMTQLEMDRNDALCQWREEELVVLSVRKELEEAMHEKHVAEGMLEDACQHILALKSKLSRFDSLVRKMKEQRETHAQANARLQESVNELANCKAELSKHIALLEAEVAHVQATCRSQLDELAAAQNVVAAQNAQISDIQRALVEASTKESLLREFRDSERASFEQERRTWQAAQERSSSAEADSRELIATIRAERQTFEARCQLLEKEMARSTAMHSQNEMRLKERLRATEAKYKGVKRQLAQLEATHAERRGAR